MKKKKKILNENHIMVIKYLFITHNTFIVYSKQVVNWKFKRKKSYRQSLCQVWFISQPEKSIWAQDLHIKLLNQCHLCHVIHRHCSLYWHNFPYHCRPRRLASEPPYLFEIDLSIILYCKTRKFCMNFYVSSFIRRI